MENETWRAVVGYEDLYEVSSHGRIRSLARPAGKAPGQRAHSGRVLTPYVMHRGYHQVSLSRGGERLKASYHAVVAAAFLGPRPEGFHVCHNDGNPRNNRADNLRYDTVVSNARDRIVHGTVPRGELHSNAKLTDYDVSAIRTLLTSGFDGRYVGRLFGVAEATISRIKNLRARV